MNQPVTSYLSYLVVSEIMLAIRSLIPPLTFHYIDTAMHVLYTGGVILFKDWV